MSLAEKDELIQALVPDRSDKPLRMRVAVWTSRRNSHALHPSLAQDCFARNFREPLTDILLGTF
jgi:hypothetical protein